MIHALLESPEKKKERGGRCLVHRMRLVGRSMFDDPRSRCGLGSRTQLHCVCAVFRFRCEVCRDARGARTVLGA